MLNKNWTQPCTETLYISGLKITCSRLLPKITKINFETPPKKFTELGIGYTSQYLLINIIPKHISMLLNESWRKHYIDK